MCVWGEGGGCVFGGGGATLAQRCSEVTIDILEPCSIEGDGEYFFNRLDGKA